MGLKGILRRLLWKSWYPYLTRLTKDASLHFLNYGYVDDSSINMQPADEKDSRFIQLYHHVVAAVDLSGLDVLEVSCGHGGGASYVARYLHPETMVAVDRNPNAIDFGRNNYAIDNLSFVQGDAVKSGMKSPLFRGLKRPLISGKNVRWTGGGGCFRIR